MAESGSGAVVIVDDAAQHFVRFDLPGFCCCWTRNGCLLSHSLVRAGCFVVVDELKQNTLQVPLIEYQNVIQAFFTDSAHPSFSVGNRIGSADWRGDDV